MAVAVAVAELVVAVGVGRFVPRPLQGTAVPVLVLVLLTLLLYCILLFDSPNIIYDLFIILSLQLFVNLIFIFINYTVTNGLFFNGFFPFSSLIRSVYVYHSFLGSPK
jgi:hypothetical protein